MKQCEVVNVYKSNYDVYIGRGSIYGNPFIIGKDGDRKEVIKKYAAYLNNKIKSGEITDTMLLNLHGKKLGCYCKPKPCHGDILKIAIDFYWRKYNG